MTKYACPCIGRSERLCESMWMNAYGALHWASWSQLFSIFLQRWIIFVRSPFKELFSIEMQQNSSRIFLRRSFNWECLKHWRHLLRDIFGQIVQKRISQEVVFDDCSKCLKCILSWVGVQIGSQVAASLKFSHFSWAIMTVCGHVFSHWKLQCKVEQRPLLYGGGKRCATVECGDVLCVQPGRQQKGS